MPALTDAVVRAAVRAGKPKTLSDGGSRGQGRLSLMVRPMAGHVAAEWYAVSWRAGRRATQKIGSYPSLSLADARLLFARQFAGQDVRRPAMRDGTLGELFAAYVAHLRARDAASAEDVRSKLEAAAEAIGADRVATTITTEDVLDHLRPIYRRGAVSLADHVRSYIRSAFSWAMKAERDYRHATERRFNIAANPAEQIPTEPKVAGSRWLTPEEFVQVWRWLESPPATFPAQYARCLQVLMATGQRVRMIAGLHVSQLDAREGLLSWERTKNGLPHVLPLPAAAAELLEHGANGAGWLFPMATDATRAVDDGVLYNALWRHRAAIGVAPFALRDLRRTWKTLAGQAGVSKEDRDRLQFHARHDVSSRHYDRYDALREKRAAMAVWSSWLDFTLGRCPSTVCENVTRITASRK